VAFFVPLKITAKLSVFAWDLGVRKCERPKASSPKKPHRQGGTLKGENPLRDGKGCFAVDVCISPKDPYKLCSACWFYRYGKRALALMTMPALEQHRAVYVMLYAYGCSVFVKVFACMEDIATAVRKVGFSSHDETKEGQPDPVHQWVCIVRTTADRLPRFFVRTLVRTHFDERS